MTNLSWSTAADHDAGQSDENTRHEQPTGTDWGPADAIQLGYSSTLDQIAAPLVAYYPIAESAGAATAHDVSGSGNDGSISGITLEASGILGTNAGNFDGTDDHVWCETTFADSTHGGDFGVSAWVVQDAWSTEWENIFNNWDGGGWALQRYSTDQYMSFYIDDGNDTACQATTDIVDSTWHHVHGQIDLSASEMEIWVDGTLDNTVSRSSVDHTAWDGNIHFIGSQPNGSSNNWGGRIAHVMVWHGTLTQSEIELLADPTSGTHTSSVQTS